ncbi:MAG: RidA family protein [Alphaproteobacteria bacterium]|nr:RidA family protein [Alphaproteobacteria bacterium]
MRKKLVSTGSEFEKIVGYSRAVISGDWCFVAGTTGYDYQTMHMPETITDQIHNCFATIGKALQEGGFNLDDVVRANYIISDEKYVAEAQPIFGKYFNNHRPASTMFIAKLVKPEMKVEIEITAHKG